MRVISREPFGKAAEKFKSFANAIDSTYLRLKNGNFESPDALKKAFPSLDRMHWWVIDVRGGNLRLMLKINFPTQTVYVKQIKNHTDYDRLIASQALGAEND